MHVDKSAVIYIVNENALARMIQLVERSCSGCDWRHDAKQLKLLSQFIARTHQKKQVVTAKGVQMQ